MSGSDEYSLLSVSLQWAHLGKYVTNLSVSDGSGGRIASCDQSTHVASIPGFLTTFAIQTAQLDNAWKSQNLSWPETSLQQPLVRTSCKSKTYDLTDDPDHNYLSFNSSSVTLANQITYSYFLQHSGNYANVYLFTEPASSASNGYSALVAFSMVPIDESASSQDITTCVIEAVWTGADYRSVTRQMLDQPETGSTFVETERFDAISRNSSLWAVTNPRVLLGGQLVQRMVQIAAISWSDTQEQPCTISEQDTECVPLLNPDSLSTIFAVALSGYMPFDPKARTGPGGYAGELYPFNSSWTLWSTAYQTLQLTASSSIGLDGNKATIIVSQPIYGYGLETVAVKLSMAVLSLYCAIVATWVVYSIATGEAGHSWDSVSELFMLALNTTRPEHIKNTSAGVATLSTFREPVEVCANEERSLELVFADDPGRNGVRLRPVLPNKKY